MSTIWYANENVRQRPTVIYQYVLMHIELATSQVPIGVFSLQQYSVSNCLEKSLKNFSLYHTHFSVPILAKYQKREKQC